jgi:cell division protein FtsW (lipid II flippase)
MIKKIVICIGISICSGSSIFASFNTLNTYLEKHPHQSNRVLQYLNTYQNNNNLSLIKKHHIQQVKKNIYNTHINTKKNDSLLTTFV